MSANHPKRLALWAILLGLAFPAACGSSGVVGGSCGPSYIDCDGRCVDTLNDPANCGGCARACDLGVACHNAVCGGSIEGGAGSAGTSGSSGESGANGDSGSGGSSAASGDNAGGDDAGNLSDASPDGDAACLPPFDRATACGDCATKCPIAKPVCSPDGMGSFACTALCKAPLVACDGQCVPPVFDTADACGACDAKCPVAKPTCSPDGAGSFECVLICPVPLKACNGQCVDFNIDENNCGSCGNVCPSGICQGGKCVGANVGHIVLACMNYQTPAKNTPQTALMGNAVLLPIKNPVRILAYTEFAAAGTRAKVDQDIGFAAAARGRTFTITPLSKYTSASAALTISDYDVFLIYDQAAAPPGQMATVGAAWQSSSVLASFSAAGGVIIGLSGGKSEMDQFFSSSQLLDVSAQTAVSGSTLYNRAPADAMGINVISPFLAPVDSCTFTTSVVPDADNIFVVRDVQSGLGAPVVVHRVIEPP